MEMENLKNFLKGCVAESQRNYDRRLELSGKDDNLVNWSEGCLSAYETILEIIESEK